MKSMRLSIVLILSVIVMIVLTSSLKYFPIEENLRPVVWLLALICFIIALAYSIFD